MSAYKHLTFQFVLLELALSNSSRRCTCPFHLPAKAQGRVYMEGLLSSSWSNIATVVLVKSKKGM